MYSLRSALVRFSGSIVPFCAVLRERISLLLESQASTSPQQDDNGDSSEEDAVVEAYRWAHLDRNAGDSPVSRSMR
jgi:hypothetical protein